MARAGGRRHRRLHRPLDVLPDLRFQARDVELVEGGPEAVEQAPEDRQRLGRAIVHDA